MRFASKSWALVSCSLSVWAVVFLLAQVLYSSRLEGMNVAECPLSALAAALLLAIPWLWFSHGQVSCIFSIRERVRGAPPAEESTPPAVAILYTTCDDFDAAACLSCLRQKYGHPYRVVICDDSRKHGVRLAVSQFAALHQVAVLRRETTAGFKAGNLNHALNEYVTEPVFAVCDADTVLAPEFLCMMVPRLCADTGLAFVQARHRHRESGSSRFGAILGMAVELTYRQVFGGRNGCGFVPCFGHSMVVRREVWQEVGGFPELMSEDLAFATRALSHGYRGLYAPDVVCEEYFPQNYAALISHATRVARGGVQFWKTEMMHLVRSGRASLPELIDLSITFSACFFPCVLLLNIVLGCLLSCGHGSSVFCGFEMWLLPVLFLGPLSPLVGILCTAVSQPWRRIRFLVCAAVAYGGMVPGLCLSILRQILLNQRGTFVPTGTVVARDFGYAAVTFRFAMGGGVIVLSSGMSGVYSQVAAATGLCIVLSTLLVFAASKRLKPDRVVSRAHIQLPCPAPVSTACPPPPEHLEGFP